jgi:hypothetical protein
LAPYTLDPGYGRVCSYALRGGSCLGDPYRLITGLHAVGGMGSIEYRLTRNINGRTMTTKKLAVFATIFVLFTLYLEITDLSWYITLIVGFILSFSALEFVDYLDERENND